MAKLEKATGFRIARELDELAPRTRLDNGRERAGFPACLCALDGATSSYVCHVCNACAVCGKPTPSGRMNKRPRV